MTNTDPGPPQHDPEEPRHEARPRKLTEESVEAGRHRKLVGGLWEKMGRLQRDFLVGQGLQPGHRLLDVGCGSLRAGRYFVDYLESGNYYGVDHSSDLLDAGWEHELAAEQRVHLPRENLLANPAFAVDKLGQRFDFAIANSVFTHIPLSLIRLCLYRVAQVLEPGGRFFTSFFEMSEGTAVDAPGGEGGGLRSFRNPYWNFASDLEWAGSFAPLEFEYIGDWSHPRDQKMAVFTRV